jgi:predicted secreted protein
MPGPNTTTTTGESGTIKFYVTSAVALVGSIRNFTVEQTTQTIESTVMESGWRNYQAGLKDWTGTADFYLNDADATQDALIAAIGAAPAAIEFYPSGTALGIKLSGNVIVTGVSITSSFDGMVEMSCEFQGSGALTKADLS